MFQHKGLHIKANPKCCPARKGFAPPNKPGFYCPEGRDFDR